MCIRDRDNGVLGYVGQGMKAVVTSANNIRIYDGVALIGGKAVVIDRDTYQDVAIANGTAGKYRNDIIYIKYTKNASTGVESVTFDVKQGTAGSLSLIHISRIELWKAVSGFYLQSLP